MPLFSEHITNMYYSGAPSYSSASYSYSGSPYGTSYSASYLNPGGNYSTHSSISPYTRTLSSRWLLGGGRTYSPILSTISEKGSSSPVRINSPRRTPISSRTYISSSYTPRPININTADIDVSRDKYRSKTTSTTSINSELRRQNSKDNKRPEPLTSKVSEKSIVDNDTPPPSSPPHRSTIKRDRPVVRLHTIKRKERDSPRQVQNECSSSENDVGDTNNPKEKNKSEHLKWRDRLAEDLAFKNKREKKTLGEKLIEKFTLKEKDDNEGENSTTEITRDENITPIPMTEEKPLSMEVTPADKTQLLGRRCSMELLAEQASLLDSLIRRENLSTATLDLSKIGTENVDEVKTDEAVDNKKRKFEHQVNPLSTTKSDHSLLSKFGTKRKSLRKSTSGDNICKLDRISEISHLPSIKHSSPKKQKEEIQKEAEVKIKKPKLKAKITADVEVSSPSSPLKVVVEDIIVEEKPLPKKKGIFYSTTIEEVNQNVTPKNQANKDLDTGHRKSVKIKIKASKQQETDKIISPDPEDGDFWGKIGKRETVYLTHRKKDLEKANEEKFRSFGWYPEEVENTFNKDDHPIDSKNNSEQSNLKNVEKQQNDLNKIVPISKVLPQNQVIKQETKVKVKQETKENHLNEVKEQNCVVNNVDQNSMSLQDVNVDLNKTESSQNTSCKKDPIRIENKVSLEVSTKDTLSNKLPTDNFVDSVEKVISKPSNDGDSKAINTIKDIKKNNIVKKNRKSKENIKDKSPEKKPSNKINNESKRKPQEDTVIKSEEKNQQNSAVEHNSFTSVPKSEAVLPVDLATPAGEVISTLDATKSDKNLSSGNNKQLEVEKTNKSSNEDTQNELDSKQNNTKELATEVLTTNLENSKVTQEERKSLSPIATKDSKSKQTKEVQIDITNYIETRTQPNEVNEIKDIPCLSPEKPTEQKQKPTIIDFIKTEIENPTPIKRESVKNPPPLTAALLFANKKPVKDVPAPKVLIATPRPLQKKAPQVIRSSSSSESSSSEESSEEDEDESSESSTDCYECENNADGRTSTGSNDSGFDSSAPTSPSGFSYARKDCDVNCHRKCEKLTANLCGVNQRLLVEALALRTASKRGGDHPSASTSTATNNVLDIVQQELEQSTAYGLFRKTGRFTPPARSIPRFRKYTIDDFQFIKVLGKGSFGKVMLAELRETEYYYAVKCLKKDVVLEDDDVECTLIERKVLALGTNHPYLCHLFATFQTDSHLFFVMEYLNGGDLMFHIQQSGRFSEPRARLYAAEIVSGLKFLHKRGIVYRDLKLDNILLDFDGHVRIADFGMCKLQIYLDKTADTFCGTPDYMAPEIIKGLKYNQTVDWWSFGVLLYEMLIGQSPFSGCDEDELFWSICNEMPSYPRFLSTESLSILTRLLDKDARTRLGGAECMHGDIRIQDFFKPIQWDKLERRELEAPFKPRVRHPLDTQYFDRAFTGERPRLTAVEPQVLRSMDQEPFRGFSYTNPNATDR